MSFLKKIYDVLDRGQRREAVILLGLLLVGMMVEMLGVGLVVPVLILVSQANPATQYPSLAPVFASLEGISHEQLVIGAMLGLVGVYAAKGIFLAFLTWRKARFAFELRASLSQRLFVGYLYQPFVFHLQHNSAQLIRNVVSEVGLLAQAVQGTTTLLTEALVLLGIGGLLMFVEPVGAILVVAIVGIAGWLFYRFIRIRAFNWGKKRRYHNGQFMQHLQQGLGGVKAVKLLGCERTFLEEYNRHSVASARVERQQYTLQQLPPLWLELLAVIGLAGLVLSIIGQGKPLDVLLPTLGLFAAAAFRVMPSVNRMLSAVQGVRYALPVVNALHEELRLANIRPAPERAAPLPLNQVLRIDNVSFRYPLAQAPSLHDVSLSITRGTSVGLIGGSGGGKSTLVDVLLGLLTPDSGVVSVDGVDIQGNLRGWQDQIGYVPQTIYLTDDSLRRNVAFGLPNDRIDEDAVWHALRAAQLEEYVKSLPDGLETIVGERGVRLSGGQRQRIGIARALYYDPPVLVLDEATSSLDTATERNVMDAVRAFQGSKTIVIVAHRISTIEHCDHLFRIEGGRVVEQGATAALLNSSDYQAPDIYK